MIACKHPWCRAEPILMQLTQIKGWPEHIWAQNLDFFLWLFLKPFSLHWHQSHTAVWHSAAHCSHPTHTGVLLAHSECCFVSLLSSFAYEQTVSVTKTMLFAVETDVLLLKWNCDEKNEEENQTAASAHFKPGALRFWAVGQKTAKSCWMETCRSATPRPHPLNVAGWFRNVGAAAWFPFIILFTGVFWGEDTWMPFPWAHSRKRRGLSNNINCQSSVSGKRTPLWYCLLVRAIPPTHTHQLTLLFWQTAGWTPFFLIPLSHWLKKQFKPTNSQSVVVVEKAYPRASNHPARALGWNWLG